MMMHDPKGLSRVAAGAIVGGLVGLTAWLASRHPPVPAKPRTFLWYRSLRKPGFKPPDPAFGIVWPVIETGLAWGGYRLLRKPASPARNAAVGLWAFNLAMIGGWSELFFGGKKLGPSAAAAGGMLVTGAAFTATAWQVDRKAAATGVPFVAWLAFATLLAEEVWRLNRLED